MPLLSEEWARWLQARGVRYVFGVPGGPSIPYMEALRKAGLEFVLVANEQSAGMMADVCGRLTGIPGVCHATFGPGATNLATGVGGARLDRSPLLAFTTEVRDADRGRKVQMNIDHQALFRPLTKWTTRLSRQNWRETLDAAFRIAVAELPGPVHIGLPADLEGEVPAAAISPDIASPMPTPPDPLRLREAEQLLQKAKRPLLAIGLTAARLGLHPLIRRFVDRHNIPVVLTPMAKGMLPETDPRYAGVLFHAHSDRLAPLCRQADLVVGIGYDSVEFNYEAWLPHVPLLHFDSEPPDIPPEYDVAGAVVGDLSASLSQLLTWSLPEYAWDLAAVSAHKQNLFQGLHSGGGATFTPVDAITELQATLPPNAILAADVGAHLHLLGQLWRVAEPGRLLMTNGWSSMGFGIPAALGAKLCRPDSPVVGLTGDGGFLMNCGELLTARRRGLNVVIVVLCDKNLSLIEIKQQWKQVPQYETALYEGEYFAADRFLGVPVLKAHDRAEMRASLQKALAAAGPVIIEAVVDGSNYCRLVAQTYK